MDSLDAMTKHHSEHGIGLIEVMIALVILLFSALAASSLQTNGLIGARASSKHFAIDHLSNDILEILRSHADEAEAGLLNLETSDGTSTATHAEVIAWNQRIADSIPTGEGGISCVARICDVSISWFEEIDGTRHRQFYRNRTPL